MREASKEWGISTAVLRAAKAAGAPGFIAHRIHREDVGKWLAENPSVIADTETAVAEKGQLDALKVRKMEAQAIALELRNERDKKLLILRSEAEESWSVCAAITCEESKLLMSREKYAIWIFRVQARLSQAIIESNAAAAKRELACK